MWKCEQIVRECNFWSQNITACNIISSVNIKKKIRFLSEIYKTFSHISPLSLSNEFYVFSFSGKLLTAVNKQILYGFFFADPIFLQVRTYIDIIFLIFPRGLVVRVSDY